MILFVKIPNWKQQSKYVQKMDKYIWYIHTIECHTAVKNKLIIAICIDADEFQKHNVGWKKKSYRKMQMG